MWRMLPVIFLLCSCTTLSMNKPKRMEMPGLKEMSLEYIQTQWGEPEYRLPTTKGQTIKFENIESRDEDPVTGEVTESTCIVRLEVDQEGLVDRWDYEECVSKNGMSQMTGASGESEEASSNAAEDVEDKGEDPHDFFDLNEAPEK